MARASTLQRSVALVSGHCRWVPSFTAELLNPNRSDGDGLGDPEKVDVNNELRSMRPFCYEIVKNCERFQFRGYDQYFQNRSSVVLRCSCIVHLFFRPCAPSFLRACCFMIEELRRRAGTHMTVSDEQASTINNWADEIDELNSSVTEQHLRAIFWRWPRKPAAQGKMAQNKKIASGTSTDGKETHNAFALE